MNRVFLIAFIALTLALTSTVGKPGCSWNVACENPNYTSWCPPCQCCKFKPWAWPDPMKSTCRASEEWEGVCEGQVMTGCRRPDHIKTTSHLCWRQCYPGSAERCVAKTRDGLVMRCKKGDHEDCAHRGAASMACGDSHKCKKEASTIDRSTIDRFFRRRGPES